LPNPRFLDNLAIQFFLLFLYLRDVLFKNLDDATLSSLGNPHNMQIKAAITENSVFVNISVTAHGIEIIFRPHFPDLAPFLGPFLTGLRKFSPKIA